jgi:hypothetical protein
LHNWIRLDKPERLAVELKSDNKDRKTNCEPPLPNSSFPESTDDSSATLVTPSGYQGGDGDITIACDIHVKEPFEGDINDLITSYIKDINEVAEEDPNAYSYEESEMKDL